MRQRYRDSADLVLLDLISEIDDLVVPAEIATVLAKLRNAYGLKTLAYLGSGVTGRPGDPPYLAVTYSPAWVEHYKAQSFVDIDPTIHIGLRRMLPIDWSDFDRRDKKVRSLFGEAGEFGLGRSGMSLPVHGRNGDRALFSITSEAPDRDWQRLRFSYMRDFHLVALHLHQAILRMVGIRHARGMRLSPRERECLLWIAEGKSYWDTSMILGLSEHTVRCYLESARHKLGAVNNAHAVSKAREANLFSSIP